MNKLFAFTTLTFLLFVVSCSSNASKSDVALKNIGESGLKNESDSLAYIIGMNIADKLKGMDSTMNVSVVCRAILEQSAGGAVMTAEDAQTQYLRYLLYVEPERRRGFEEQFLADLAKNDRTYTRSRSGLTYHIEVIGDEKNTPKGNNDLVSISYTISRIGSEQIYPKEVGERAIMEDGLSELPQGITESVKMIGKGGKISAWIPSKLAYGEAGNEEFGIAPTETLLFDIELVEMTANGARKRGQATAKF